MFLQYYWEGEKGRKEKKRKKRRQKKKRHQGNNDEVEDKKRSIRRGKIERGTNFRSLATESRDGLR